MPRIRTIITAPRRSPLDPARFDLEPVAAAVHGDADGSRSAAELVERARLRHGVAAEDGYRILDALADLGLLEGRAFPPAGSLGMSRRLVLRSAAAGLAAFGFVPLALAQVQPLAEPSPTPGASDLDADFRHHVERFEAKKKAAPGASSAGPSGAKTPTPHNGDAGARVPAVEPSAELGHRHDLPQAPTPSLERQQERNAKKDQELYEKQLQVR